MDEHLKKVQEDVDLMNKSFDEGIVDESVSTDPPGDAATDPPATGEPKTDPPATDPPAGAETDPPKTDAPTTDAPDDRDQTIKELRDKLAKKEVTTKAPTTKAPTTDPPLTFEEQDFLKDYDVEDVTGDPKELNKLLNVIYQRAVTDASKLGKPAPPLPDIPAMVTAVTNLQKATDQFYDDNEDLKSFKKVVATVFDDLVTANPDKNYADLMTDVAPEVRKRLELPEPKKSGKRKSPKLPRKKQAPGRSQHTPKTDSIESELDEMNKTLGR